MLKQQSLIWETPSQNSQDSMPIGGGGIGLNVWFENGELLVYFQQSGNFDEHNGFPKQGRLRISNTTSDWAELTSFKQELNSQKATIQISIVDQEEVKTDFLVWVNTSHSVYHIEYSSSKEQLLSVAYESWRYEDKLSKAQDQSTYIFTERNDIFAYWMYPKDLIRHKDVITQDSNSIRWWHQNDNADLAFDKEMDQQGFCNHKQDLFNPQRDLVFGGSLVAKGMQGTTSREGEYLGTPFKALCLKGPSLPNMQRIDVYCCCEQVPDISSWHHAVDKLIGTYNDLDYSAHKQATQAWWAKFWQRSWIDIQAKEQDAQINAEIDQVSRNYRWFRFMQGFNVNGNFPLKFNGGLVTYDSGLVGYVEDQRDLSAVREVEAQKAKTLDGAQQIEANENLRIERDFGPDYRAWGGGSITPQNQRLLYWPLLKSGDFDLFEPQFSWYKDTLETTELRSQLAFGHDGCSYTEQINNFGLPIGSHFGWERPKSMGLGQQINRSCDDHYSTQLEFAFMMLEYQRYSQQSITEYLPFIQSAAQFFFSHYEYLAANDGREAYDENGHLHIFPSSGLESYKEASNPNDVTCGLRNIYQGLLRLEDISAEQRTLFELRLSKIPPLIHRQYNGYTTIAPAYDWAEINNVELPQMYPVYPYQEFGVGLEGLQIARDTWEHSCNEIYGQRSYASWHQDGIFCAHLGLVEEAKQVLICKLGDGGRRFPAFWGPGHDWTPDHNWGGTGMIQLQEMLVQDKAGKIVLLPCWPKNWDVDFKLHLGLGTTLECEVKNGEIINLVIEPKARMQDIETDFELNLTNVTEAV
ncbi:hypothetical protein DBZ36_04740 [Alginatibacterium sediminis]|uniref:DUF5703 domain-containing protein n=1 Tax=Alginatibacterium sediminis TaxID=2164068 RepID=A0A420EGG3_9ALTE|nr:DUF5703 domain-containing protein [Alginatibacterium sediminis]RKF19768.1 hypothetical protein DBZ36_04740 [Alginatibacterium sediminis]